MNILLIDDDLLFRRATQQALVSAGHNVALASNGEEALGIVAGGSHPDAIICDVMMPRLTGPGFILSIRKKFPPGKKPVVIMISGMAGGEDFVKELDIEYDHYLQKPLSEEKLSGILGDTI